MKYYLEEIKYISPPDVFEKFLKSNHPFFLDSSLKHNDFGRFSYITADPYLVYSATGTDITIKDDTGEKRITGEPFDILKKICKPFLNNYKFTGFCCGGIGYISYGAGKCLENIQSPEKDILGIPDIYFAFYDWSIICDNIKKKMYIFSSGLPVKNTKKQTEKAKYRLKYVKTILEEVPICTKKSFTDSTVFIRNLKSNFSKNGYTRSINRIKEYIRSGDVYQVNLSQRFSGSFFDEPYNFYKILRKTNPTCFSAFLDANSFQILSVSPERFLNVKNGKKIETRPIKGTRPKTSSIEINKKNKKELLKSKKDIAELIMIVDLERNDLGKVCQYGSVKVDKLIELEEYANVYHLVATVRGYPKQGADIIDCLKACFPGGSITGAPKIRSMQIINELETVERGIYTGSIGYISFSNCADFNIAIRTAVVKDREIYFNVGGGIVIDSNPKDEYIETLAKGKPFLHFCTNKKYVNMIKN